MRESTQYQSDTDPSRAAREAAMAITELRKTIGSPTGHIAEDLSARIGALARDKNTMVEWDVRVVKRGESGSAACNCHCYAV